MVYFLVFVKRLLYKEYGDNEVGCLFWTGCKVLSNNNFCKGTRLQEGYKEWQLTPLCSFQLINSLSVEK